MKNPMNFRRGRDGQVDEPVLVLRWTGADAGALLTPSYIRLIQFVPR